MFLKCYNEAVLVALVARALLPFTERKDEAMCAKHTPDVGMGVGGKTRAVA